MWSQKYIVNCKMREEITNSFIVTFWNLDNVTELSGSFQAVCLHENTIRQTTFLRGFWVRPSAFTNKAGGGSMSVNSLTITKAVGLIVDSIRHKSPSSDERHWQAGPTKYVRTLETWWAGIKHVNQGLVRLQPVAYHNAKTRVWKSQNNCNHFHLNC